MGTAVEWILGIGAAVTALFAIGVLVRKLWKVFGWHGAFWAWMGRFVNTVDVIAVLPQKLETLSANDQAKLKAIAEVKSTLEDTDRAKGIAIAELKATLDHHIEDTRLGREEWDNMKGTLHQLVTTADSIKYEVKHNGGGSMKDQTARIEAGVAGLYAQPGESGVPGREDHREAVN